VAALAPRASGSSYSTFIHPTGHGNLTFAVSAATSGDVYIHLSAPATYSWVAVGTGSEMAGSVMWIVYEGADRKSQSFAPIPNLAKLTNYRPNTLVTTVK
jgi:hypothetical protein